MNARIIETLKNIEEEYRVKILYACESGSRHGDFLLRIVTMMSGSFMCIENGTIYQSIQSALAQNGM